VTLALLNRCLKGLASEVTVKGLSSIRAPVPFCRQTPLTLKAQRAKDYSQNRKTLGEHLKKRRRELGLLQREAAEMLGVSTDTVVNWEKDKTTPVASQFRPVVAFLGYDPTPEPQTLAERLEAKQRRLGPASPRLPDTSGGTPEASSDTSTAHGAYRRTGERY
jgi:DNA-binding XRE family transcriptional regulator